MGFPPLEDRIDAATRINIDVDSYPKVSPAILHWKSGIKAIMKAATKIKRIASRKSTPDSDALLKIAAHLRDQAGKEEDAASWRDKTFALLQQDRPQAGSHLQVAQLQRDAGNMNADPAFHIIAWTATALAMDAVPKNPGLNVIAAALRAIERREEMEKDEQFPTELKQWDQRYDEIIADVLRAYREGSMADLHLNDRDAFDRQFEAGQRQTFKGDPETYPA